MSDSEDKKNQTTKKQQETKNTETTASSRRKLLKAGGVVASSALVPEKWTKPVVDNVLLPAHAQTSAPLIGAILITGSVVPTRPSATMMAGRNKSILDALVNPAYAGISISPTSPTPSPTSPTPSPTSPTPSPTSPTPSPTSPTPSPSSPTPSPTGCAALGQCAEVFPPNASNQVPFTISNVGSGMLPMTGPLAYMGTIAGITINGAFTNSNFTDTAGTLSGAGCTGTYTASTDGSCTPGSIVPTPTP